MFIWQMTLTTRMIRTLQALREMGGSTKTIATYSDENVALNRMYHEALGRNFIVTQRQLFRESLVTQVDETPVGKEKIKGMYQRVELTEKGQLVLKLIEIDAREMTEELTHAKPVTSKVK